MDRAWRPTLTFDQVHRRRSAEPGLRSTRGRWSGALP